MIQLHWEELSLKIKHSSKTTQKMHSDIFIYEKENMLTNTSQECSLQLYNSQILEKRAYGELYECTNSTISTQQNSNRQLKGTGYHYTVTL